MKKKIIITAIILIVLIGIGTYNELSGKSNNTSTLSYHNYTSSHHTNTSSAPNRPSNVSSACNHIWNEADCYSPKKCKICGKTLGTKLGHDYQRKTCEEEGVCSRCGNIQPPIAHKWVDATCIEPKTCSTCGKTKGKALGHTTDNGVCERCGLEFFKPINKTGYGDSAVSDIKVGNGLYTIHFTHNGNRNFIVYLYDADGDKSLIVNEIGNYDGTVLLTGNSPYMLNIQADGEWSYTIDKLSITDDINFSGHGDYVTPIFSGDTSVYKFTHDGDSNFIVRIVTTSDYSLIINEIGAYQGTQIVEISGGNAFFEITADGNWTITKQ